MDEIKKILGCSLAELDEVLEKLLKDLREWADDFARDYNQYDYVLKAKKIRESLKKLI